MYRKGASLVAASLILAACGTTPEERGITGAGLGAAGGAIIGAVTGLSVLEGALIGTGVGGATGLLTSKETLDIGDPVWKRKSTATAAQPDPAQASPGTTSGATGTSAATVRGIQSGLDQLGYDPGPVDGIAGPRTREAIRQYQRVNGLAVTGEPSPQLAEHIAQRTG